MALVGDLVGSKMGGNDQIKSFVKNAVLKVFASGLDQADEFEADRIGVVIAARAGYDPFGLPSVLQVLQGQNNLDDNFALIFKTHPTPGLRIEKLDSLMQTQFDSLSHNLGKPLKERLKEFK
jgi:predicted Zn-dependent protease